MKVGTITESQEAFTYKNQRFSDLKFIICIRDDRYEFNVNTIIAVDNGKLIDLDEYEFGNNLFATRPPFNNTHNIEDLSLNRFYRNELIKINFGTIIENGGAENPNLPKVKTFNANINAFETNQIIEFFEGELNEEKSLFTPDAITFELIKNVYVETENCFFVIIEQQLIGPFIALKVNGNSFEIAKSSWRKFGEYELNNNTYLEFRANELNRKIFISECKDLNLVYKKDFDFVSDDDLLKLFEMELKSIPDYFNESSLENIKKIIYNSSELKSLDKIIKDNNRLKKILETSEKVLIRNIDLINFVPEVKKIKEDKQKIEEELFVSKR